MENNGQSARPGDPVHVRAHLGQWLRAYRTSLGDRVAPHSYHAQEQALSGIGELSILALVATLEDAGYTINPQAYSEVEAGDRLPEDLAAFLNAVATALKLPSREIYEMWVQAFYDILRSALGSRLARECLDHLIYPDDRQSE